MKLRFLLSMNITRRRRTLQRFDQIPTVIYSLYSFQRFRVSLV